MKGSLVHVVATSPVHQGLVVGGAIEYRVESAFRWVENPHPTCVLGCTGIIILDNAIRLFD